jgi:hypothetical protein
MVGDRHAESTGVKIIVEEGHNLQCCQVRINYDLLWDPMEFFRTVKPTFLWCAPRSAVHEVCREGDWSKR